MIRRKNTLEGVCSLDDHGFKERREFIQREVAPYVVRHESFEGGLAWEFEPSTPLREKLDWLVAQERRCCGSWEFAVHDVSASGLLRLEVLGVAPDSGLYEIFGASGRTRVGDVRRTPV